MKKQNAKTAAQSKHNDPHRAAWLKVVDDVFKSEVIDQAADISQSAFDAIYHGRYGLLGTQYLGEGIEYAASAAREAAYNAFIDSALLDAWSKTPEGRAESEAEQEAA